MALTREQILAAEDLKRQPVEVPEWGGTVFVREMTGAERMAYEKGVQEKPELVVSLLVACTACDESGALLFGPAAAEAVNGKNAKAIKTLFDASVALNRIAAAEVDAAGKG